MSKSKFLAKIKSELHDQYDLAGVSSEMTEKEFVNDYFSEFEYAMKDYVGSK